MVKSFLMTVSPSPSLCSCFLQHEWKKRLSEKKQDGRDFSSEKDLREPVGKEVGKRWERQEKTHKEKGPPKRGRKVPPYPEKACACQFFLFGYNLKPSAFKAGHIKYSSMFSHGLGHGFYIITPAHEWAGIQPSCENHTHLIMLTVKSAKGNWLEELMCSLPVSVSRSTSSSHPTRTVRLCGRLRSQTRAGRL